jgi:hypothetical protein
MAKQKTGAKRTKGTVPFSSQLDPEIVQRFKDRALAERRSIRVVLEKAMTHYMETIPLDNGDGQTDS